MACVTKSVRVLYWYCPYSVRMPSTHRTRLPHAAQVFRPALPPDVTRGLWLGLLGVVLFAMTVPMTRLAVGPAADPQLPPLFVTAGRAALAGLLSVLYLHVAGARRPGRPLWPALAVCAAGTALGFPLFLGLALRRADAVHASVVTGVLPLATAVVAARVLHQRPSNGFWACAGLGCALVAGFAAWRGGGLPGPADGLLLAAVASGAAGYVAGARLATQITAEHTICWVLASSLPLTLPVTAFALPADVAAVRASAWWGFGYVTLFSMWIGFFAWYRGLALGGTVRVSQVQLLQPFLSLLFAVPLTGERLDAVSVGFALAVAATVFFGRRMPAGRCPPSNPPPLEE